MAIYIQDHSCCNNFYKTVTKGKGACNNFYSHYIRLVFDKR